MTYPCQHFLKHYRSVPEFFDVSTKKVSQNIVYCECINIQNIERTKQACAFNQNILYFLFIYL